MGHVRLHDDSQIFIACLNFNACLEGNEENPLDNCAEGYEGVMCSLCSEGYWKTKNTWECLKCGKTGDAQLAWNIVSLIFFLAIIVMIYLQMMRNFKHHPQQEFLAIFRIITNTW